jgi:hypothetical protein
LFFAFHTGGTYTTGVYKTTDPREVADLEAGDMGADGGDPADDFVTRNHGVDGAAPFVTDLVYIGVTYATIEDIDAYVVGTWFPTLQGEGAERGFGVCCGICFGADHGVIFFGKGPVFLKAARAN